MKKNVLVLFLLIFFINGYAQVDTSTGLGIDTLEKKDNLMMPMAAVQQATLGNTIVPTVPPSPHAAELGRFGAVPVGLYTGTNQYSIPIFTLQNEHLSLPISLNYASNGFKVDKLSSWTGYDWSLNAGGVITRYRKGKTDIPGARPYSDFNALSAHEKINFLDMLVTYERDLQPDIFVINLPNFTCKFAFNNDGDPVTIPHQPIKIETNTTGAYTYFNITTPDGILYKFEDADYTAPPSESSFATAWHLSEIVHPTGEAITFSYDTYSISQKVGIDRKVLLKVSVAGADPQNACGCTEFKKQITSVNNTISYLREINFEGVGKVVLEKSNGRADALNEYKLDEIIIKNHQNGTVKSFKLNYQFPYRTSSFTCQISTTNDVNYRMFLTSLDEKGSTGTVARTYSFEYNSINALPARFSYAQDHWGYFNGKYNNDIISINDVPSNYQSIYSGHVGSTANRLPNYTYSKKGMLNKITFPTGGYTTIDYQANKNSSNVELGGCRVLRTKTYESSGATPIIKKYNYLQASTPGNLYPTYYQQQSTYFYYTQYPSLVYSGKCNYGVLSANSLNMLYVDGQNVVCYPLVEVLSGENGENGKEKHSFNVVFDAPGTPVNGGQIYPIPVSNNGWSSGVLTEKLTSNGSNQSVNKEVNNYYLTETRNKEEIKCLVSNKRHNPWYLPMSDYEKLSYYDVVPYSLYSNWFYVNSSTVTQYNSAGNVVTTSSHTYGNATHCQPTQSLITNSDGKVQKSKFYYPHDYSTSSYYLSTLRNKHIINKPVDTRTYYDNQLAKGTQIKYNADGMPISIYKAEPTGSDISFSSSSPYKFTFKATINYNTKDAVNQVTPSDNHKTIYLWDATGNYLMAKIENARSYTDVSSLDGKEYSYSSKSLYNSLNAALPDDVLITTYTHNPLVGISQQTNTTGVTTYYYYDSFGRLSSIKNDDGKLLKKFDYHYAN